MRKTTALPFFALLFGCFSFAQTGINPTTTLTAETSNNTSTAATFVAQSNGNAGPGNVSKADLHSLLYGGSNTTIYAHFMGWFGQSNHMNVGYTSSDPNQVHNQVTDAISRGIAGFILDWYGPNNAMPNATAGALMQESESQQGAFSFAIMEDGGALNACHSTPGCNLTDQLISDLTYVYNNYEQSPAYMTMGGRPVVFFFDADRFGTLDWARAAASVPGNPILVFQNSGGFSHAQSGGSFAWVIINTSNPDDWSQGYLANFYNVANSHGSDHAFAAPYKGFNDTLAAWSPPGGRIMNQNCAQTWLSTFSEIGNHYSAGNQLESIQLVTWNDYEEGTEIESGIDNCVSVNGSVNGDLLTWNINGSDSTLDHFTVFISADGENLMSLGDVPASTRTLDLSTFAFVPGSYTVYVKAVGVGSVVNHMSGAISYSPGSIAPSVTIYTPADGDTVPTNLHIVASSVSPQHIEAMQIYLDYQLVYEVPTASIDTTLFVAPGLHHITVKMWQSQGGAVSQSIVVNAV